jgi:hypothetical protein
MQTAIATNEDSYRLPRRPLRIQIRRKDWRCSTKARWVFHRPTQATFAIDVDEIDPVRTLASRVRARLIRQAGEAPPLSAPMKVWLARASIVVFLKAKGVGWPGQLWTCCICFKSYPAGMTCGHCDHVIERISPGESPGDFFAQCTKCRGTVSRHDVCHFCCCPHCDNDLQKENPCEVCGKINPKRLH